MKRVYTKPAIMVEELQIGPICTSCVTTLTNSSDLSICGAAVDTPFGEIFLFPQGAGGCTCWEDSGFDMYCYQPSYSSLFGS